MATDEASPWVQRTRPLAFSHVDFSYGKRRVFRDLTWGAGRGLTALMGPNGAGKTTLLSIAAGLLRPQSGAVHVDSGRSHVSLLPQHFSFVGGMRVRDAVVHASWCAGVNSRDVSRFGERALASVDLLDRAGDRVKALSGGMRQRLGIACALSADPSVLLLDEPSVGLDPMQRRALRELLVRLARTTPIVLSTHLVDDVIAVADRIAVLAEGTIRFDGTVRDFVGSHEPTTVQDLEEAYLRTVSS